MDRVKMGCCKVDRDAGLCGREWIGGGGEGGGERSIVDRDAE